MEIYKEEEVKLLILLFKASPCYARELERIKQRNPPAYLTD